jgi:hypothetical protein
MSERSLLRAPDRRLHVALLFKQGERIAIAGSHFRLVRLSGQDAVFERDGEPSPLPFSESEIMQLWKSGK